MSNPDPHGPRSGLPRPEASARNESATGRRLLFSVALLTLTLAAGWAASQASNERIGAAGVFQSKSRGPVHLQGRLDRGSVLQDGDGLLGMELLLSADASDAIRPVRVATDLVVILDRSGSMSGKPLSDAKAAVRELIQRLGPDDRFALVTYESNAQLAISLQVASPENRRAWQGAVDRIGTGGGTNMSSGIDLAAQTVAGQRQAGRLPRVILLSDGHANEGDHSYEGLRGRAGRAVVGEYVVSTVGVGEGFDEVLMTALADAGTGNFYYVRDGRDLGDVFAGEFESARETVASAVTVEIELAPGVELLDAAGYPVERDGVVARFRPGTLFAGQERRVWLQLRAPTESLGDHDLGSFRVTWRDPQAGAGALPMVVRIDESPQVACVKDEAVYVASLDSDLVLRGIGEEKYAVLEQEVAAEVRAGRFAQAQERIQSYKRENAKALKDIGYAAEETRSYQEADALAEEVKAAFTAPASAPARNALSKKLSASGQDARRKGAKKSNANSNPSGK